MRTARGSPEEDSDIDAGWDVPDPLRPPAVARPESSAASRGAASVIDELDDGWTDPDDDEQGEDQADGSASGAAGTRRRRSPKRGPKHAEKRAAREAKKAVLRQAKRGAAQSANRAAINAAARAEEKARGRAEERARAAQPLARGVKPAPAARDVPRTTPVPPRSTARARDSRTWVVAMVAIAILLWMLLRR